MATSRSVGNYSTSAKAVIRSSDQIFDAAMSGKPDFTKISKEAIKGRSMERRAVTKAEGNVAQAGLEAFTKAKRTQNAADTAKEINDIKRPAKRMAGIVAGLGAIGGAVVANKGLKADKAEREALRAEQNAINEKTAEMFNSQEESFKQIMEKYQSSLTDTDEPDPKPNGSVPDSTGSTSTSSTSSVPSTGLRSEVYSYLTKDKGLSTNKALGLMANIDRESSFRTNPQGGDGGNSFGMFQWNNTYGRSDKMKGNVKDWQTNWKGQIDHALGGNQLPEYNKVTSDYLNTTFDTPQAAADYWMTNWERPADTASGSKKHAGFISSYNF